ncbi:porin [Georhizobium profundi]|jgi:hypothetical protein|uniref:Porin n=1 Tax=Georhizobium profundi TaxID=2341112 RepID=A0A3Q8XQ11_9HYPH|nr:porin [Georhizobium profundi]AZN72509.1 porin [Georhizobium profundi]
MNIKSLLLGSAAALFAVSGAQAADAIIAAEPEPLEYVRVCDAFGTGYFYIPGTETCLSVGGRIRLDYGFGDNGLTNAVTDEEGWAKRSRAYLYLRSATDTEWGPLTTYTEMQFQIDNSTYRNNAAAFDGNLGATAVARLPFATISLGGLTMGKSESMFTQWTDYAGSVINDGIVGFGPFDAQLISYTYDAGNGFSAMVSIEDDISTGLGYIPDVVAGAKYEAGAFALSVVGGYDENEDEGAIKARLDGSFGGFSAFVMGGYSTNEAGNRFANWNGDWAVWGGLSAPVTERITFNTQLSYDEQETFGAVGNLVFNVARGFDVTTEVYYADDFAVVGDADEIGGTIRFQRTF